jgi:hypothetical protein
MMLFSLIWGLGECGEGFGFIIVLPVLKNFVQQ